MIELYVILGVIYFVITGTVFLAGGPHAIDTFDEDEVRLWARICIASPIWPIVLLAALAFFLFIVIRYAFGKGSK